MGGFPGFNMGQQRQKGDALKEFVSVSSPVPSVPRAPCLRSKSKHAGRRYKYSQLANRAST